MKHQNRSSCAALLLALALTLSLTGCGASSGGTSKASANVQQSFSVSGDADTGTANAETEEAAADTETDAADSSSVYQNSDVKLIRRASLSVEATDLDAACASLEALVKQLDGYMEDSSLYQGSYGSEYRSANYTVRIPSEQYDAFLSGVESDERCHLVSREESTEDVGQAYADTEEHITALKTKLNRLNELMAQAENMEDIITIESAISETEQELDSYSSDLNRYDDLIDYATITVDVEQVDTLTEAEPEQFPARLAASFLEGCGRFWSGAQDFAVWVAGNIWSLLLAALLIALFLRLKRRHDRRRAAVGPGRKSRGRKARGVSPADPPAHAESSYQPAYHPEEQTAAQETEMEPKTESEQKEP